MNVESGAVVRALLLLVAFLCGWVVSLVANYAEAGVLALSVIGIFLAILALSYVAWSFVELWREEDSRNG